MLTNELRGELAALAGEIEPFGGDAPSLHRREHRRRVITSSLAVALVVGAVFAIAAVHGHAHNRVEVSGEGAKEVPAAEINHVDVIVVPVSPTVQKALDASPSVARYARLPQAVRGSSNSLLSPSELLAPFCALESDSGYAVQATTPGSDFADVIGRAVGGQATAYDVSDALGADFEIFLNVGATNLEAQSMRARLMPDADVASFRFISHLDAYAIFKKDFVDQPALVESTKPSDLPMSFRINLVPGASREKTLHRYEGVPGVSTVSEPGSSGGLLFNPEQFPLPTDHTITACTKP